MADVFISYSRAVRPPTLELAGKLWGEGYTTWTDTNLGADTEPFQQIIDAEVDSAKAVITIWSPPAIRSRWVNYESKRAQRMGKLFCTHTQDVNPDSELPGDFHGLNSLSVNDFTSILNSLVDRQVRPEGKSEADLPREQMVERQALREWRERIELSENIDEVREFLSRHERARMVRDVARQKLQLMEQRAAAKGDLERERVLKIFETIRDSNNPEEFEFFFKQRFDSNRELALIAAGRLQELDPERFLKLAQQFGNSAELKGLVENAGRAVRLRNTPPEAAILRLDPGMHIARINRIAVSGDGKLLATASHDKTAKIWELPGAKLLNTLRPPIGEGNQGRIDAVALDPKGRWAATGGWTSPTGFDEFITIFDIESGHVIHRLGPLPNVVNDIQVSPDGARIAAGLHGENGIRVWDTKTWALVQEEKDDYRGIVYGLAFADDGRLAVSCYDGKIRLYSPAGKLMAREKLSGGASPYGIGFANGSRAMFGPGGDIIAVAYRDVIRVDLLDGRNLKLLGQTDVSGLANGTLSSLAFFGNGMLAAGGQHGRDSRPVMVWSDRGKGARSTWPGAEDTIMDLAALPDGSLALGSADPALGVVGANGKSQVFRAPEMADLRGKYERYFGVSPDGLRVWFGLKPFSEAPVLFDIAARTLVDAPSMPSDLVVCESKTLPITDWTDTTEPKLGGRRLILQTHEISRSVAIAPDAKHFALGTEWRVRYYDAAGEEKWDKPVPGVAWGVQFARNGGLVLAAYGDGTIRWRRAEDGKELLALFIHLPKGPQGPREWILFTPEGFYDASSSDAEKLIGWHVNRGPDHAADFYPAETFAAVFRRPDTVDAALDSIAG